MQDLQTKTVREIALEMPVTTRVFETYKIDYCCHGDSLFNEACQNVGADPAEVLGKIDSMMSAGGKAPEPFNDAPLGELLDYILETHHVYTKQELEQLPALMNKVATRHGDHLPELMELKAVFQSVCDDLGPHLMKEEMVLFPYIEQLEINSSSQTPASTPAFGTVLNPVRMMRMEHEEVGSLLAKMRELSNDYTLPEWACPSFTALYHRLAAFELDLHRHIHLENNILFQRAVELEQNVSTAAVH